ncbi:hypothetical protein ASE27_10450 [Oerskovia sp. Root918]|uniref:SWIM zinc finger family protein n=1 Tax=Oerskovia sp. Root918 TaxID=1736607 RepID=UPI0006F2A09D|nr:SWIM zinc finger family protein [Oerskovia sp. Root918]KRD36864.1 hypothetical protein ASE27_10450 [Oerskovia sp. Root918]
MTPAWLAVFAGYDDAALIALGNAGLLRRARKDLVGGEVSLASESPDEVVVACGSAVVRLGPKGPVAASCSCPTAGVCQHVVAACLWAREHPAGSTPEPGVDDAGPGAAATDGGTDGGGGDPTGPGPGPATTDEAASPLAALLSLSPAEVCRAAGKVAVRRVVERLPSALLAGVAAEGNGITEACDLAVDGARLTISWPIAGLARPATGDPAPEGRATVPAGPSNVVVFVAPAGYGGMVVAGKSTAADQAAARLEAVVRAFAREGRSWSWPHEIEVERSGELTTAQRAGIEEASAVVGHVVDAGLSHLGADAADTLRGAAGRARLVGLLLLHRLLLVAAGLVDGLASRDDDVTEADALGALAEAWALAAALRDAPAGALPDLVGAPARRARGAADDEGEERPGRLVPLGVRWWRAASGARGMTLTAWDQEHGVVRTATAARPSGADPAFRRDVELPMLWGSSVASVCAGPFTLDAPETRPDGTLSVTSRTRRVGDGRFDVEELRTVADRLRDSATTGTVGFGRAARRVRLVMVRETGAIGVEEVRREVTWPVTAADGGTQVLRVAVDQERSVEALLSVVASRRPVVAVLVEREPGGGADEPVGIFLRDGTGGIELFSPSMSPVYRTSPGWTAMRRLTARIAALRKGSTTHVAEPVDRGPVVRVCQPALEVVDSLGATGRRRLTGWQHEALTARQRLAGDLGMATVGRSLADLLADPTTENVLRARFVLGRALALTG